MRLVIAGSRSTPHREAVVQVQAAYRSYLKLFPAPTTIIHGDAKGIDAAAKCIFTSRMEVVPFTANWDLYGKAAGPIRNKEMARAADTLLAVWDGDSRGTKSMINCMREQRKPVIVTHPNSSGMIWLSYGISPAEICRYNGWKPGTVLDYQGDLYKITRIDENDVWGHRANLGVDSFDGKETWLSVHWEMADVTSLLSEG